MLLVLEGNWIFKYFNNFSGGFILIRQENGEYNSIDFRETAPSAAYEDMFENDPELALESTLAMGVPGEIRGFEVAHKKYGY